MDDWQFVVVVGAGIFFGALLLLVYFVESEIGCISRLIRGRKDSITAMSSKFDPVELEESADYQPSISVPDELLPSYWGNHGWGTEAAFQQLFYVSQDQNAFFKDLLHNCAQAASADCSFEIRRVIRIESSSAWSRYLTKVQGIQNHRLGQGISDACGEPLVLCTSAAMEAHPTLFAPLQRTLNEVYAFHGTSVRLALNLAQNGFNNINLDSCLPNGINAPANWSVRLSDCSSRADADATDDPGGYYAGVYAQLLCRVCLGKVRLTEMSDGTAGEQAKAAYVAGDCDSICNKLGYHELAIYDPSQVYPEYLLLYSRAAGSHSSPHPVFTEVPIYWRNVAINLPTQPFERRFAVRPTTQKLLQFLVGETGHARLLHAWRVENSTIWKNFMKFKNELRADMETNKQAAFPGFPESASLQILEALRKGPLGAALLIESIDKALNEQFLYHGTSRQAALAAAANDFQKLSFASSNWARFGDGFYFTDSLDRCLSDATSHSGRKYILLCRVICGNMYYTEKEVDHLAISRAEGTGRSSVLAHPGKSGPLEVIVSDPKQIYPEWILEVD